MLSCALGAASQSAPAPSLLTPVFPVAPPGLVYVEGEDAVSTNMATEPTLNYGCSGNRALQLARAGQLSGGAAYYAEYCAYVDRAGSYELWYGGTPPGPKDEFLPSLASPVSVSVDGGTPRELFREDVNVIERYAPAYYWVKTPALNLAQGAHVIRFEVSAKRRLDDRYFFYLDAFFLASSEAFDAAKADRSGFPSLFPKKPNDRSIDHPLRSVEEYQAEIQLNPAEIGPYFELADEYSLSMDYLDALKTLAKGAVVEPKNADLRLLIAKNRLWRGDVKEGIEAYGIYISLRPDDLGAYEEAGKIAAWSNRFSDSEYFYQTGLAAFPGNSSLMVNLGLSLLWANRSSDAERNFAEAERLALVDPVAAGGLAAIYRDNGFPDRAIAVFEKAIAAFPDNLGLYLDEEALLTEIGKTKAENELETHIAAVFEPSPELDAALAAARARRQLKTDRIADFEARIAAKPEDLGLRDELTRIYAWNGRKAEAAPQLESILAARFARAITDSDAAIAEVYAAQFSAAVLRVDADARLAALVGLRAKAQAAQGAADKAMTALLASEKAEASAAAAGKSAPSSDSARAAAGEALAKLAPAIVELEAEDARVSILADRAALVKAALDESSARDEADEKAFKAVIAGLGWTFDTAAAAAELALPAARGEQIAALARARILVTAKDLKGAQASLTAVSIDALAAGRLQAELIIESRRDYSALYKAAIAADGSASAVPVGSSDLAASDLGSSDLASESLLAAARELAAVASAAAPAPALDAPAEEADSAALAAYAGSLREEFGQAIAADDRAKSAVAEARVICAAVVQGASSLEDRRLQRAWYAFESGALDLRSELGSYYDGLGLPESATRQYRRVLVLDPSNVRAMYSLALDEEKVGDWAAASALYKSVNAADPDYPFYMKAASLSNDIARKHAPSYDSSTTFLADPNLFDYRSDASALLPFGSLISLKPFANVRSIRDRYLGYPAYIGATLGMEAPIRLLSGKGDEGIVLRPSASFIVTDADFSAGGIATITPPQFLGALSLYSTGAVALDWAFGAWKGSASYSYAPLPDSLNPAMAILDPAIFVLYAHTLELSAGAYLPLNGIFRYIAPRISASGAYVPNDSKNLYGTVLAEVIPAFRLSDAPWSNLGIPLDLVYEDSKKSYTSPYYAADQALTAKGGLLWQSTFAAKNGEAVAISLEGMGGVYMSPTFKVTPTPQLYLNAFTRLDWMRRDATYSLSVEAAATDPFGKLTYWSCSILGGVSTKQPSLISP